VDSVGRRRRLVVSPDSLSTHHVSSVLFCRISVHQPLHWSFSAHTVVNIRSVWVAVRLSRSRAHRAAPVDRAAIGPTDNNSDRPQSALVKQIYAPGGGVLWWVWCEPAAVWWFFGVVPSYRPIWTYAKGESAGIRRFGPLERLKTPRSTCVPLFRFRVGGVQAQTGYNRTSRPFYPEMRWSPHPPGMRGSVRSSVPPAG